MTLTFSLNEYDYLQHQLYVASTSASLKARSRRSWLTIVVLVLIISWFFFDSNNALTGWALVVYALLTLIFYPAFQKRNYKKYYRKYVATNFNYRFGKLVTITFLDTQIFMQDVSGETKLHLYELKGMTEIKEFYFLHLRSGGSIILPKYKFENIKVVREKLLEICGQLNIVFTEHLDWKWK